MMTEEQRKALHLMESGKNVFLSGEAGTGKSFVIQQFVEEQKQKGANIVMCAPTGIAALNIGGATLHRAFGAPIGPICPEMVRSTKSSEVIEMADIIIIDEISMCRFDLFSYAVEVIHNAEAKAHKHIQLIVVGDFYQLPPVITAKDRKILNTCWKRKVNNGYAFESPWWEKCHFTNCYLRQVVRQSDINLVYHLNRLRVGDKDSIVWFNQNMNASYTDKGIIIVPTNALANKINRDKMNALSGETRLYMGNSKGDVETSDRLTAEKLIMKTGMRVMALVNDCGNEYCNGSLGTVQKLREDGVIVRFDNGCEALITPYTWQIENYAVNLVNGETSIKKQKVGAYTQLPLKAAYAVTVHKSQGQTYSEVNLYPRCFAAGQLYVALSRCRDVSQLHLCEPISPKYLITSTEVGMFYKLALDNAGDITHDTE